MTQTNCIGLQSVGPHVPKLYLSPVGRGMQVPGYTNMWMYAYNSYTICPCRIRLIGSQFVHVATLKDHNIYDGASHVGTIVRTQYDRIQRQG